MKKLIILPTYNEAKNITKTINMLLSLDIELDILVVDDNSPDGTADLVKNNYQNSVIVKVRSKTTSYITKRKNALRLFGKPIS